ncbi:MAG: flagellar hook-length control protein FliK [Brevundimonas sp.]|uniref:flagellar hook-length control protein FliK n=1 Tax=Brevundimonas sp. TaxID=1871086 RepID=UPI004034234F
MSAQAILPVIAPAAAPASQGAATGDAVAFRGLLATALSGDAAVGAVAGAGGVAPPPLLTPMEESAGPGMADADLKTPEAPVEPVREVSPPVTKLPEPIPEDAPDEAETDTTAVPAAGIVAASAVAQQMPTAASSGTSQSTTNNAAVAAALAVLKALDGAADEAPSADNDDTIVAQASEAARMAGKGQTQPPAEAAPATPPPALRQLAERTARPHGDASNAERAFTDDSAPARPATTGSAQVAAATPSTPEVKVEAPPPVIADTVVPETGDLPVEGQTADTGQQSAATATVREAHSPGLSRSAVEATVQIAAQIQRRLEARNTRFEIALTPDDLGRVDVRLDIDAEGRLAARLAFDNPAAAADLRGRADELRRQLEQFGFQLADDAFEFAERDSGSSAFDRGQDARDGQGRAFARANRLNLDTDTAALTPRWTHLSLTPTGVDLKV